MDARLIDEHEQIQDAATEFLEAQGGIELARRVMDGESGVIEDLWSELVEMDYTALTVPLEHGGLGDGMVTLVALSEALGRYAMPGPFPETVAFAVPLINAIGSDEQRASLLPRIADGAVRIAPALYDTRPESVPSAIQMRAEHTADGYRLSGTKTLVPYAGTVESVLIPARTRDVTGYDGISLFLVDTDTAGIITRQLDGLDRTRPLYDLEIDCSVQEAALLGPRHRGGDPLRVAIDRFTIAACAMLVGAADRAVDLSVDHGNEREQYGQPIGRFQAVKHRIADMWMTMQDAKSLVYYAAWAMDADRPDADRAVAAAKSFAADRLHDVFGNGMFNHGGMGFTWEHDGHIYLKQAKAWRNFLGTPEEARDRVIRSRLAELDGSTDGIPLPYRLTPPEP